MAPWGRLIAGASIVALVGGSSVAGVAVGRRDASTTKKANSVLEQRLAALEALRGDIAGDRARLDGFGTQLTGMQQAISADDRTVKVTGEAYLPTSLRALTVAFTIQPTHSTAGKALSRAQTLAASVTSAVRATGISSNDIRTVWDTTYPSYERPGSITSSARVLATVRDISRIDKVVKAATAVDHDVRFGYLTVSDESSQSALSSVRGKALDEAAEKAALYAKAAGRKLGAVRSISEDVAPESSPAVPAGDEYSYQPSFVVVLTVVYDLV